MRYLTLFTSHRSWLDIRKSLSIRECEKQIPEDCFSAGMSHRRKGVGVTWAGIILRVHWKINLIRKLWNDGKGSKSE
jgi:hypothetical protein